MVVSLTPLILEDQGKYRCEITYEDQAGRWFKDSCLAAQVTNLIVYGQPDYVKVSLENETEVENGATIGPYVEGQLLVLRWAFFFLLFKYCTCLCKLEVVLQVILYVFVCISHSVRDFYLISSRLLYTNTDYLLL